MPAPKINRLNLESVDSTNTYAKDNFDVLADGMLVCAEMQTAGRGRLGRRWVSPPSTNIYASLVMKQISNPFYATVTASLAVLDLLQETLPRGGFFIKWPNDIYSGHKKISGILCEAVSGPKGIRGIIAGIGININLEQQDLDRIDQPAASLKSVSGKNFDLEKLTDLLADKLAEFYGIYLDSPEKLFAEWKTHNKIIGRQVTVVAPGTPGSRVLVRDIAENGELIVEENGTLRRFNCGDISLGKEDRFE